MRFNDLLHLVAFPWKAHGRHPAPSFVTAAKMPDSRALSKLSDHFQSLHTPVSPGGVGVGAGFMAALGTSFRHRAVAVSLVLLLAVSFSRRVAVLPACAAVGRDVGGVHRQCLAQRGGVWWNDSRRSLLNFYQTLPLFPSLYCEFRKTAEVA